MENLKDCIKNGLHLTDCDNDGFCNHCGHQDTLEDDEPSFCCTNCGGGFKREDMEFDEDNENDFCNDCAK